MVDERKKQHTALLTTNPSTFRTTSGGRSRGKGGRDLPPPQHPPKTPLSHRKNTLKRRGVKGGEEEEEINSPPPSKHFNSIFSIQKELSFSTPSNNKTKIVQRQKLS